MSNPSVIRIVHLCAELDAIARDVYARLSTVCRDGVWKSFWNSMAREEAAHLDFWRRVEQSSGDLMLPDLFEDPDNVAAELQFATQQARQLLNRFDEATTTTSTLVVAYRMEFCLLHPAFELLFHTLRHIAGAPQPADYVSHLNRFVAMLARHGNVTPELELLGETLNRLWRENRRLAHQATRDDLTGLLNRRGFLAAAVQLAHLAQRNDSTVGLMMIDLDRFKAVNDRLGHEAGDSVLKSIGRLFTSCVRTSDLVARYGGEEFVVFLPSTRVGRTAQVAEKMRLRLQADSMAGMKLTLSVGVAEGRIRAEPRADLDRLIRQADVALYQAKAAGRNQVVPFVPEKTPRRRRPARSARPGAAAGQRAGAR